MSVRVNLLPEVTRKRARAGRQVVGFVLAGLVLLGALGGLYWLQTQRISEREEELARERDRLAELDADVAALGEFADLETRAFVVDQVIVAGLGDEVTLAGALQDLVAILPPTAWLENFAVTIEDEPLFALGAERSAVGRLSMTGIDLDSHAPGLEQVLLDLERMAGFSNPIVVSAALLGDEAEDFVGATGDEVRFSLEVDLGPELRTERYTDGLPEELR